MRHMALELMRWLQLQPRRGDIEVLSGVLGPLRSTRNLMEGAANFSIPTYE